MNFRLFLILIILGTFCSWGAWGLVVYNLDPTQIGPLGFSMFYLSLFLGLAGIIFLVMDYLKAKMMSRQLIFFRLRTSVRHSIFFSALTISWLFLKSVGVLRIWSLLLLIIILTVLEFFFISIQKQNNFYERAD